MPVSSNQAVMFSNGSTMRPNDGEIVWDCSESIADWLGLQCHTTDLHFRRNCQETGVCTSSVQSLLQSCHIQHSRFLLQHHPSQYAGVDDYQMSSCEYSRCLYRQWCNHIEILTFKYFCALKQYLKGTKVLARETDLSNFQIMYPSWNKCFHVLTCTEFMQI